ncbi:MAG: FAD-dependent oxidoreductase [Polyangiales bacterium]
MYPTADETLAHLRDTLGRDAVDDLASFLAYAREIWNAAAPRFVFGPAPSLSALASRGAFGALLSIDPLHTMRGGIDRRVRSPHLRALLYRYATYNGGDVRRAPATLNCIAHVELSLGGFGVEGGIHALITAMVRRAEALGVEFRYGTPVRSIRVRDGRARGVVTDGGSHDVDAVVSNADVAHLVTELLPRDARGGVSPPDDPSLSGWTAVARARRTGDRVAHTVVFPKEYLTEFRDLFDRDDAPSDPTVYLCAQEACHGRAGWSDGEPVFLMANAPAGWSGDVAGLRARVLARAVSAGLLRDDDPVAVAHPRRARGALSGLAGEPLRRVVEHVDVGVSSRAQPMARRAGALRGVGHRAPRRRHAAVRAVGRARGAVRDGRLREVVGRGLSPRRPRRPSCRRRRRRRSAPAAAPRGGQRGERARGPRGRAPSRS